MTIEVDFLFPTMQMMAKLEVMEMFAKDEFGIIIIDEVHRAGAETMEEY